MEKIEKIRAMQILDSRGNPTVQVTVKAGEAVGTAMVPSGASTGSFEAVELRDENKNNYFGKSVEKAVENVNEKISKALVGENICNQKKIDELMIELDGTENKANLGANAILGTSMAVLKCAANSLKLPAYKYIGGINGVTLPTPMMNILNGGKHADSRLSVQEFMIVPRVSHNFRDNLRAGAEIYHSLKKVLKKYKLQTGIGDEGGFAPNIDSEEMALDLIIEAIREAGYSAGENIFLALDVAATEMYEEAKKVGEEGKYYFWKTDNMYDKQGMINYLKQLVDKYPIISIEDGLAEEDWKAWQELNNELGDSIQLVGDDLFVTNKKRLKYGITTKAANSILIKPNQIGTISETLETIELARKNGYGTIISHRSGETEDTLIADLAVGTNAGQIKTGAPCRSERVAKYNRLLNIEEEISLN